MTKRLLICGIIIACAGTCVSNMGCSAAYWGGDTSGERPGVRVRTGLLGTEAEVSSDCNAKIRKMEYSPMKGLIIEDGEFGQSASAVVREEPAKIRAIGDLQLTQVEYAKATWAGVIGLAHELVPVLKLLAMADWTATETGWTATLPGGLSLGTHRITSPAQIKELLTEAAATVESVANKEPATQPTQ